MAVVVTHAKVTPIPDDVTDDPDIVSSADWNDNHTVTGLGTAAEADTGDFAAATHSHAISDVTGLQTALDGKAATSHTHTASAITDFASAQATVLNTTAKGTPIDADRVYGGDSTISFAPVYATWTQVKAFLKTYFDTLYQPLLATLTSWGAITRASGFDTFVATPSWTNFLALVTGEPTFYTSGGTDVSVADGGTGRSTSTTAYGLIAAGTTATGAHQTLAAGATTEILVGGGASALPVWTTATGSGAPVRATSPTLVTPVLGTPSSGTLTNCTGLPNASVVGLGTAALVNTGTSGGTVPLLNAQNTFGSSAAYFSTTFQSTDSGPGGPIIYFDHASSSPAANDEIGFFIFNGRNSAAATIPYVRFVSTIEDANAGSEDSRWALQTYVAGTLDSRLTIGAGAYLGSVPDKGVGTVNVGNDLYINSIAVSRPGAPVTKTANFTVADSETWLINNKSGSSCTVTLPTASSFPGRELNFKNSQAQTVVSASSNVVPRVTAAAGTAILASGNGNWCKMVSDGTNWVIMAGS